MIIRILFIVSALNIFNIAQDIKVLETEKLPIENGYNPKFILNDSKIVFSKSNYKGLYLFDSATKTTSTISNEDGAGYNPLISQSDKIIFRETKFIKGKKFHDLNSFDIISNTVEQIESNKRSLKLPSQKFTDDIILINENEIETKKLSENRAAKSSNLKKAVFINNGKIILVDNEVKKELQPVGDGIYVWASLSNDQTMITFSFGNRGSFISDLNGKILQNVLCHNNQIRIEKSNFISGMYIVKLESNEAVFGSKLIKF